MQQFIGVIVNIVSILLLAMQLLMLVRAIMSWLPFEEGNVLYNFVFYITEPVITPIRILVEKIPALRNFPLDISFFLTFIILIVIRELLPAVHF